MFIRLNEYKDQINGNVSVWGDDNRVLLVNNYLLEGHDSTKQVVIVPP